jgi:hypothetical protein
LAVISVRRLFTEKILSIDAKTPKGLIFSNCLVFNYPIFGSSANITAMAGIVLAFAKGGNTATALRPTGVRARTWADAPFGDPPPPAVPGAGCPEI